MTNQEIKTACEDLSKTIEVSKEKLRMLQMICKHENTFEGYWSWRIGSQDPAIICSDCGCLVKYKHDLLNEMTSEVN